MPYILVVTTKKGPARHGPTTNDLVQHPPVDRAVHRHHVQIRGQALLLRIAARVVHGVELHEEFALVFDQLALVDMPSLQRLVHQETEAVLRQLQLDAPCVRDSLEHRRLRQVGCHAFGRGVRHGAEVVHTSRPSGVGVDGHAPDGREQGMPPLALGGDRPVSRQGYPAATGDAFVVVEEPVAARPRPRARVGERVFVGGCASPAGGR
mmetsp:Transcript_20962/g.44853  ORF Transcript_20962/g.44853 Transcript_20962/m.44853 type:complete len:208 (+) Transcript_20962:512-1135(+)